MPGQWLLVIAVPERETHEARASAESGGLGNLSVGGHLAGGNASNNLEHPLFSVRNIRVPPELYRVAFCLRGNARLRFSGPPVPRMSSHRRSAEYIRVKA